MEEQKQKNTEPEQRNTEQEQKQVHHHHHHDEHEHHHEHHHHDDRGYHREHRHIDKSIDTDTSFMNNLKKYNDTRKKKSKLSKRDITSRFRDIMRERYLRKRLFRKIIWYLGIAAIVIMVLMFLFSYCIDIQEDELLY